MLPIANSGRFFVITILSVLLTRVGRLGYSRGLAQNADVAVVELERVVFNGIR